jgi:Zn ribbon nucleic-acid-binding protein
MELHQNSAPVGMRARRFMACAQCGEPIHVAAWSEHVDDRRVRHVWECEACGYAFETLVCFPTR